jgi:peptide/nickel transport system substrate-binding protein
MERCVRQSAVSRRNLLRATGTVLLVTATTGCDLLSTDPDAREGGQGAQGMSGASSASAKEAPALTRQVEAGKLPPLADRIPKAPLVVSPTERTGSYGGMWRSALLGPSDTSWLSRTVGYETLLRWDVGWTKSIPNVAESFQASADGREFTFKLRAGMRWSDGKPFTAADIVFAFKSLGDPDLYPAGLPLYLMTSKGAPTVSQEDEQTVRFRFPEPSGLLLDNLSFQGALTAMPQHYLRQFHQKSNPEADALAKKEKFQDWVALFLARADRWSNQDLPTLCAWKVVNPLGKGNQVIVERNPYYWKTDPDGRQLPYLDRVVFDVISDSSVLLLKATNGEFDMHTRHINTSPNKPVLARGRTKGHYHFVDIQPCFENQMVIALNLTHEDPELRKVFRNKEFRIGLSHAINRQELVNAVFQRQGKAWQAAPRRESPFYDEGFANQYTDYDEAKANEILDQAGYARRDSEGFRLRPDGTRIAFAVEVASPALIPYWPDAMEMIRLYWQKVGVKMSVKSEDRSLFYERKAANKPDATVWTGSAGREFDVLLDPRWYFPFNDESNFAIPWAAWFTSRGKEGERPPERTQQQMALYRELQHTPDQAGRYRLMKEILGIAKEEFYAIGTVLEERGYGIVNDRMRNVATSIPESHLYNTPAPTNPEQYFLTP